MPFQKNMMGNIENNIPFILFYLFIYFCQGSTQWIRVLVNLGRFGSSSPSKVKIVYL